MQRIQVPRLVDKPPMVLFWSIEEIMLIGFFWAIGMYIEQQLICIGISVFLVKYYRRFNNSQLEGFYLHYIYLIGAYNQNKGVTFPSTDVQEYIH